MTCVYGHVTSVNDHMTLPTCREEQDKAHAAKIAQKMREEEEIQMALWMQDEVMAKKMQQDEVRTGGGREGGRGGTVAFLNWIQGTKAPQVLMVRDSTL